MHALLKMLSGNDRRSIGQANQVASMILEQPELFSILLDGMASDDPILRMRCADAAEKVSVSHPEYLLPWKMLLIKKLSGIEQQEVRWHVAPMLARLPLTRVEEKRVFEILLGYTRDRSRIVKTAAMQALADVALRNNRLCPQVLQHIQELTETGSAAMKARGRKLIVRLSKNCPGNDAAPNR